MDPPNLKLIDKKWLDEAAIKAKLATGVKLTLAELRPLAHPMISDYKLNKWIREAGSPTIKLDKPVKPRQTASLQPAAPAPPGNAALAWAARLIGGGFGAVGFVLNCVYAFQFGNVLWQSVVNAAIGGLIDLVSMFGLAWAFALPWWHRLFAILVWVLAIIYSFLIGVGFFSTLLGDHARTGATTDQYRADLTAQLARAETDLAKLRDPKNIDKDIQAEIDRLSWTKEWSTSEGCIKSTRSDYACIKLKQLRLERDGEARRDPLKAEIDRLSQARHGLGGASGRDTIAEQLGPITITYRNIVPALILTLSGLLIAFSRELRKPHAQNKN